MQKFTIGIYTLVKYTEEECLRDLEWILPWTFGTVKEVFWFLQYNDKGEEIAQSSAGVVFADNSIGIIKDCKVHKCTLDECLQYISTNIVEYD